MLYKLQKKFLSLLFFEFYNLSLQQQTKTNKTMKAIIVKNNNFETVGFEVTANATTLFQWGISPLRKDLFQKEIDCNDWMTQIFELVRIKAQIEITEDYIFDWFRDARTNKISWPESGVTFTRNENKLAALKAQMENIIKNII
jgi:hypothetical protein